MGIRASTLLACLLLSSAAAAETVYKYRQADGQVTYSNRRIPNAELIETFDYKFPAARAPAAATGAAAQTASVDERMQAHIAALNRDWARLQDATRGLAAAEARLAEGLAPLEGENSSLAGPPAPALAPSEVGGPQAPASPAVGGPMARGSAAVGGPTGTLRGGGRNAEYLARMDRLETDVRQARIQLDLAQRRYNELR